MMHRTHTDFWSRRGIQSVEQATVLFRCPCWAAVSATGQATCRVCEQRADIPFEATVGPAGPVGATSITLRGKVDGRRPIDAD